jgi:hypothetical protein
MICDICQNDEELYAVGERDDGTLYERTDGSFSLNDLHVCVDCLSIVDDDEQS